MNIFGRKRGKNRVFSIKYQCFVDKRVEDGVLCTSYQTGGKPAYGKRIKKMKKITALLLALCMVFALAACGTPAADPTDAPATDAADTDAPEVTETPEETEDPYADMTNEELVAMLETVVPGTLTVATSPDFAPYEFYALDENGSPYLAGFDLALAEYLADYMGLEIDIIPMDFDGVTSELGAGYVDIGLAGLSPDAERRESMDFSDLYYLGGQSFVTTQDKIDLFPDLESVNNAEYSIGAQNGSIQQNLANEYCDPASVVILTKVTDIVAELVQGTLDGAFIETAVAENYAAVNPELAVVLDVPYEEAGSAVGVVKGNAVLLELVNRGIAAAIEDGSMARFVTEANELSLGDKYEGLLDSEGKIPSAGTSAGDAAA